MIQVYGDMRMKVTLDHEQVAQAVEQIVTRMSTGRGLYIEDGKVYASDSYGPYDDSLISEDPDDVILVQAARIIRERKNGKKSTPQQPTKRWWEQSKK